MKTNIKKKTMKKRNLKQTYKLSDKFNAIREKMDKERADLKPNKYELEVTVWLLKNASWQGARRDIYSFLTLKDAKECKTVIQSFIKQQKRTKNTVQMSEEEEHYWNTYLQPDFCTFWKVGRILKRTEEVR